jgi:hypothetical protein
MTDESRDRNTGEADQAEPANSNFAVLAAIAELGLGATPAAIAKKVGIAYSTVNPKLRAWETAGLAERFRHDTGQTLWRLTDAGRASTATPPQFADAATPAETARADSAADEATEPDLPAGSDPAAAAPPPVTADSSETRPAPRRPTPTPASTVRAARRRLRLRRPNASAPRGPCRPARWPFCRPTRAASTRSMRCGS